MIVDKTEMQNVLNTIICLISTTFSIKYGNDCFTKKQHVFVLYNLKIQNINFEIVNKKFGP